MAKRFTVNREMPNLPKLEGGTPLSFFDPENPDVNLFNLIDDEIIRIAGSPLQYFKSYISEDFDDVYLEAQNKTIASEPIIVHGHYEPSVVEEVMSNFGIELTNDQLFVFNKSYIESTLNRPPSIGDQIKPQFQNQKYEIIEVQEEGFEMYGVYHMACTAKLLRDNEETLNQDTSDRVEDLGGYIDLE
tara:strand:+ start:1838 stop:2401 length:564 start_codon:yes stop_codon:yes gene_type:complete